MSTLVEDLPLQATETPDSQAALAALVADAYQNRRPIYPIGGGTSLDYGLSAARPGLGLSVAGLNRVIDYPQRDMTITVEAGITLARLAEVLAEGGQWLPIDATQPTRATLGGAIATAASGPRRYGFGTLRDYVIGISAVDGRGEVFKGGGRVVKNVAGYDFCKLLTGSLGTLGVITQVTLKLKPLVERSELIACELSDRESAEQLLAGVVTSATTPTAVELLAGPGWDASVVGPGSSGSWARLVLGVEGTSHEVEWMLEQIKTEWRGMGIGAPRAFPAEQVVALRQQLRDFPAQRGAPLVIKATMVPSRVTSFVHMIREHDPDASIQAHAGNGIVIAQLPHFTSEHVSRVLIGRLQPAARQAGGSVTVLSSTLAGLTRQAIWGGANSATEWMQKVKRQFDPRNILNPDRFVYDASESSDEN
jgi:glycolate oxidase FAD binding subunit